MEINLTTTKHQSDRFCYNSIKKNFCVIKITESLAQTSLEERGYLSKLVLSHPGPYLFFVSFLKLLKDFMHTL